MLEDESAPTLCITKISAGPDDQWRLTDPYIEEVWSEFLGPTSALLARRLGRLIEHRPAGVELQAADLGAFVGVSRTFVLRALQRLHRFDVVHCDLDRGVVGVSGYAPSVGDIRLHRLSEAGRIGCPPTPNWSRCVVTSDGAPPCADDLTGRFHTVPLG